jgi:hypothetical protein
VDRHHLRNTSARVVSDDGGPVDAQGIEQGNDTFGVPA